MGQTGFKDDQGLHCLEEISFQDFFLTIQDKINNNYQQDTCDKLKM